MNGRDATTLVSMPVIATQEGRELGRVKDVLFDPQRQALLGLLVTGDQVQSQFFIGRHSIRAIGNDAVTVESSDALAGMESQTEARAVMESGIHLRGAKVVSEEGNELGKVDKVFVDETGNISGYRTKTGLLGFGQKDEITPEQVTTIGQDAIVVNCGPEDADPRTESGPITPSGEASRPDSAGSDRVTPSGATRVPADESMER